jgi:hypothetical protein
MLMSHHTHVALAYAREQELRQRASHAPTTYASHRHAVETAPSVGRLRRRLAQMHLAPAPQP